MKRLLVAIAGVVVLSTALAEWDGTSWVFDTSGRPADVVVTEPSPVKQIDPGGFVASVSQTGLALDHGWYTVDLSAGVDVEFNRPGFLLLFR